MAFSSRLYDIVICGGGAAGCSLAHKFSRYLGAGHICVIEPSETHYYQTLFTLVGGGLKPYVYIKIACTSKYFYQRHIY